MTAQAQREDARFARLEFEVFARSGSRFTSHARVDGQRHTRGQVREVESSIGVRGHDHLRGPRVPNAFERVAVARHGHVDFRRRSRLASCVERGSAQPRARIQEEGRGARSVAQPGVPGIGRMVAVALDPHVGRVLQREPALCIGRARLLAVARAHVCGCDRLQRETIQDDTAERVRVGLANAHVVRGREVRA